MVKPMAQHSQPMRLPGRRATITAPTLAKAKKGTQIATPTLNSRVESPSLASRNPITSPSARITSSHRPQACQDAERGAMRSRLGDLTTRGGEGSPVVRSMVAPFDPHPAWRRASTETVPRTLRSASQAKARLVRQGSFKCQTTSATDH
jgi:hypothetical protein